MQNENMVGELPSVELSTAPLVSEHDVVFAYYDPAKYRRETLKKIHEYLVKIFSHNDVILIPDGVSMMVMPRESAIKQLKGVIAALEEDA